MTRVVLMCNYNNISRSCDMWDYVFVSIPGNQYSINCSTSSVYVHIVNQFQVKMPAQETSFSECLESVCQIPCHYQVKLLHGLGFILYLLEQCGVALCRCICSCFQWLWKKYYDLHAYLRQRLR